MSFVGRRILRSLGTVCVMCLLGAPATLNSQVPKERSFPQLNRLPPGELLISGGRSVLPDGFVVRSIDSRGLTFTKSAEGWVPYLYDDSAGYCTIGYGHLIKKAKCNGEEAPEFRTEITKERGGEILGGDLTSSEYTVMTMVTIPLTDGQFSALTDFVFNVGSLNFRTSTLLKVINAREIDRVSGQFRRWVMAGGKSQPGLRKRRVGEVDLFFVGIPKPKAAPSPNEDLSPIDIRKGE